MLIKGPKVLKNYYNEIYGATTSWYNTYINPKPIVLNNKTLVYSLKEEILKDQVIQDFKAKNIEVRTK